MNRPVDPSEQTPRKTYRLMAGMAVAAIALISVAIYSLSQLNNEASVPQLKAPPLSDTLRNKLPQFEYSSDSEKLKPADFEGHWTILSFWAFWCTPCLAELPTLNQLAEQWQGRELNVITVNLDDPKSENYELARKYLVDNEISLVSLFDKTGVLKQAFHVTDLPRHFLINPKGEIVWEALGAYRWTDPQTRDELIKLMGPQELPSESDPVE